MEESELKTKCSIVTPEFRVSYEHAFKPHAMPGTNNPPKYSVTMLFPKKKDIAWATKVQKFAMAVKFGTDKSKWPKRYKELIGDGDGEAGTNKKTGEPLQGYAGHWVMKAANEKNKPQVLDENGDEILEPRKFYSGCYAKAAVYCYVWEFPKGSGKFGVGMILDHLKKERDGKAFSQRKSAAEAFGVTSSSDDLDNDDDSENFDEDFA